MRVIAVDFDGTCVDHRYPKVGEPAPGAVETLRNLAKDNKLILWTMRDAIELNDAVEWFKTWGIPLYGIQRNPEQDEWTHSPKCYAQIYIDDAAFGAPLIKPEGFHRKCIDWAKVRKELL